MTQPDCYWGVCFAPLQPDAPSIFSFAEYLSALALMVLAWTIGDLRYRFRIRTAPLQLHDVSFGVIAAVGVLTLLTDLWRANQWPVPQGNIVSPSGWQALLAGAFLGTFLLWAWFATIRPPVFSRWNAKRYGSTLYTHILQGSASELATVADELRRSAASLVHHATEVDHYERYQLAQGQIEQPKKLPLVSSYANDILLLIADRRFCRAIIQSAPATAYFLFKEIARTSKYGVTIGTFGRNIVSEAIANKDSFLYHEAEGYDSGLLGYHKPLTHALFGNASLVETVGSLLDQPYDDLRKWDRTQWEAYCRAALLIMRAYVKQGHWAQSNVLYRVFDNIGHAVTDLYVVNDTVDGSWDSGPRGNLFVVMEFFRDTIKALDRSPVPTGLKRRRRTKHPDTRTVFDDLAESVFEVIFSASQVRFPWDLCWSVQYVGAWDRIFNSFDRRVGASRVVYSKLRRLLYDEVAKMSTFPNFKGARILGLCLNVMGLTLVKDDYSRDSLPLQKAILGWTRKHYDWLHKEHPRVAEACLVDRFSYDAGNHRIVRTYPAEGLRRVAEHAYLDVEPYVPAAP